MKIPDINLLLYAYDQQFPQHEQARQWWRNLVNSGETIGMPWVVLTGFVRILTTPRVLSSPRTVPEVLAIVEDWRQRHNIQELTPGTNHYRIFSQLVRGTAGGRIVTDAHLAALAIEYNAELHSNDTDFARFRGLRWVNPLQ